ncbi:hypothetical protein F5883DRAFT_584449 [Diaporthe sp. PMI_573]|nr:hypothetical protein F5883DRAFT_584449 [Diaporthaceae sp. PMI_573]
MPTEQLNPNKLSQPAKRPEIPPWIQDILDRPSSPPALQFWQPPEDPDKPFLPYTVGFTAEIQRRQASTAEALGPELPRDYLETVTHSEAIMAPSSLKPETNTDTESDTEAQSARSRKETAQLVVTAPIAIGAARGAQLLAVTVAQSGKDSASGKSFEAVAKIYDPLYYNFESEIGHHPEDCVYTATNDLIHEATAYECLHRAGQTGSFAPEYHGCWYFSLPITIRGTSKLRSISLVLIERLNGDSILSTRIRNNSVRRKGLDSFHYPEEFRLEVLARAMDGYVRLLRAGIMQRDFAARNLILVAQNPTAPPQTVHGHVLPRVVLIDYNKAEILDHTHTDEVESLPANPATVFWAEYIWHQFPGWVPHEWEDTRIQKQWLLRRFAGPGRRELYLPIRGLEL